MICSICRKREILERIEEWRSEDGITVKVPKTLTVSVLDPRNPDGGIICEECYEKNLLLRYTNDELHEIHTQFGLEYRREGLALKAEAAFRKALAIKVNADALANLALSVGESNKSDAKNLYLMALDLEPDHFMARNNLNRIAAADDVEGV